MSVTAYGPLQEKLKNKEYRDAFVSASVRHRIALQIRAMRKKVFSTQRALGDAMNKPANVISRMEDPSYGKLSISSLLELASTFDVGLVVKFVRYSEVIEHADKLSDQELGVPQFDNELDEELAMQRLLASCVPVEMRQPRKPPSAQDLISGGGNGRNNIGSMPRPRKENSAECVS